MSLAVLQIKEWKSAINDGKYLSSQRHFKGDERPYPIVVDSKPLLFYQHTHHLCDITEHRSAYSFFTIY